MDVIGIVATVLGNVALVVGIVGGLAQLRRITRDRQNEMVLRAYQPFLDPTFSRAFWTLMSWDYATYEDFAARATIEDQVTLDVVAMQFEMMGVLYHRKLASLELLDDLVAPTTIMTWNKIAPIIYGIRRAANTPDWSRWHEALAIDMDARLTKLGEPHDPVVRPETTPGAAPAAEA
jgi:hypothetical protein